MRSARLGIGWYFKKACDENYTYEDIARNKRGDMDKNGLEAILRECAQVFDVVKPLCRKIRDVLFPQKDGLFTGTPQDPNILYNPIINAFNDTIAGIKLREADA